MRATAGLAIAVVLAVVAGAVLSGSGTAPGTFDYYVLSLSWSPEYCATSGGNAPNGDLQCRGAKKYGFVLHGLWPQYAKGGWPTTCSTTRAVPPEVIDRVLPIMPSRALPQHEWDKHGTCSGKDVGAYFDDAARAFSAIRIPEVYRHPDVAAHTSAERIRADFLAANPGLRGDGLAVVCDRDGATLLEVRVCLDKALKPRACGRDVRDHCAGDDVTVRPVRR